MLGADQHDATGLARHTSCATAVLHILQCAVCVNRERGGERLSCCDAVLAIRGVPCAEMLDIVHYHPKPDRVHRHPKPDLRDTVGADTPAAASAPRRPATCTPSTPKYRPRGCHQLSTL